MAFQTMQEYNTKKYDKWFVLLNDQDSADVIFLYKNVNDALMATVHYIKGGDYSGYVHCAGSGCPACAKGIRRQTKFFIPLYNITAGEIQYWDRTDVFTPQFNRDVFQNYPNPSEFVFRVTRHGQFRDPNTRYSITVAGKNTFSSMDEIMAKNNLHFPEAYSSICREMAPVEISALLNSTEQAPQGGYGNYGGSSYGGNGGSYGGGNYGGNYGGGNASVNYQVTPRAASSNAPAPAPAPAAANPFPIPDPVGNDDTDTGDADDGDDIEF